MSMTRVRCWLGLHSPKKAGVRYVGDRMHAPCRGCGVDMVRGDRKWVSTARRGPTNLVWFLLFLFVAIVFGFIAAPTRLQTNTGPESTLPLNANRVTAGGCIPRAVGDVCAGG